MLLKKTFIYLFIFILIGELMIRFDEYFTLLEENRIVKISTDIELTPEYQLLKKDSLFISNKDLRIMVIGDSYIHGGGIEFNDNFSQQLKKKLKSEDLNFKNIWVLDVSKSSSNNLDNNKTYFQFVNIFKPKIVILGYNINDIEGNLDKVSDSLKRIENFKNIKASSNRSQSLIKKIYSFIYNSRFAYYVLHNTHRKLNSYGVIIPNSKFDLLMRSYSQNKENWRKSKILLDEIINDAKQSGIQMIIYKLPETNLLEYPQLFSRANKSIELYFNNNKNVIYLDGTEALQGENPKAYMLSKYDGHPNELAHKKMAEHVFEKIINFKR